MNKLVFHLLFIIIYTLVAISTITFLISQPSTLSNILGLILLIGVGASLYMWIRKIGKYVGKDTDDI